MANKAIIVELDKQVDTSLALSSTRLHQEAVPNPCVDANNEEVAATTKCKHFSIRGYVSEVRKRDPKLCYPFPLNESIDPAKELPPMTIPESRWWRCSGCVPEAKNYDIRLPRDSCGAAKEEAQKGVNVNASNNDLRLGLSSKVDNTPARVRIPEAAFTSAKVDNTPVVSNTLSDRKGKGKAHVTYDEIPPFSGRENGFLTISSEQNTFQQTTVQIEINQRATDNEGMPSSVGNSFLRSNEIRTDVGFEKESTAGRTEVGSSNGYSRGDPQTSTQHRLTESATNGLVARLVGNGSGSSSRSRGPVNLPDLNECSDEPSDELLNEATVTGNNYIILSEDDEDYLGTERRKRPKSRLMSELLSLKETEYPGKGKKKMISSSSSQSENVKRKRIEVVISDSEDESVYSSDVSNEKMSGFSQKRRYKSKDSLVEARNKKMKMENGASSSLFRQKITKPKSSPERVDCFAHLSEGNKVSKRKRGSGVPARNMTKECGTTQKVGEVEKNTTENVVKLPENVGQFLSNYPNQENNNQQSLQKKDSLYSPLPPSAVDASITGKQSDPERRTDYPTTSSSEKTTRTPETDRCRLPAQHLPIQVSNSVPKQKEQTKEIRGRVHDIDINSIPTDDKPNELGPGDDNLMEIAELMVKIRHERQNNPIDNRVSSGPPPPPPISGTNVRQYGQPMQIFGSSPLLNLQQKPPSGPSTTVNGNSSHYPHYIGVRGAPRENPVSSRFEIHAYSASTRLHASIVQAVDSHQKFQAWSPQQGLPQPSSVWPPPGMPSRMPMGITNPRQMISPRSNNIHTLNDSRFRHQNSRTFLNFENPAESSSSRSPPSGVDVNEAIPAMHLLSLMQNAATVQNTELSLGPQRLVAPSSSRFLFSKNSRHPCYPSTLPTASPFPSSLGKNSGSNGFMDPIPLTLGGQRNMESSRFTSPPSRSPRPPRRQARRPMAPPLDKGKGIASTSNPASVNNTLQVVKESLNLQCEKPVSPPEPEKINCQLNQNPSEFNDLKLVAKYLNGPEDLKPRENEPRQRISA
ncbi:uncharacterized protein LOC141646892 [Silene latifolia]|uniref:uncharacterized protein LOC141646892 n=1 Tax=Silene latifolia TaxID=37657 RepID=UPI003D7775E1